jgi:Surfeit locus protein 2 (SURF2)
MDTLDADLRAVLAPHEDVFSLTESGKIQCKINGHTLPARLDVLQAFVRCGGCCCNAAADTPHAWRSTPSCIHPAHVHTQTLTLPFISYCRGPKFQTLLRRQTAEDSLSKYEPFIVQSANFPCGHRRQLLLDAAPFSLFSFCCSCCCLASVTAASAMSQP